MVCWCFIAEDENQLSVFDTPARLSLDLCAILVSFICLYLTAMIQSENDLSEPLWKLGPGQHTSAKGQGKRRNYR